MPRLVVCMAMECPQPKHSEIASPNRSRDKLSTPTVSCYVFIIPMLVVSLLCVNSSSVDQSASASSASASLHVHRASVPPMIVATWINYDQPIPDPDDGLPSARCDHTFISMQSETLRENVAVPFRGSQLRNDPFESKFFLLAGVGPYGVMMNDSWILDVSTDPPSWSSIDYSSASDSFTPRWGQAVALLPDGFDVGLEDVGLTAIIWGGNGESTYLDDLLTFNFASMKWRTVIKASLDHLGSSGPFARGYVEWMQLPNRWGSNTPVDDKVDAGFLFTFGGRGASDGERFGENDHTLSDEWIFSLATRKWQPWGETVCKQNSTTCADAQPLYSYSDTLTQAFTSSALDLTKPYRPRDALPALVKLLGNMQAVNASLLDDLSRASPFSSEFTNHLGACVTTCSQAVFITTPEKIYPPKLEGHRLVEVGGKLFSFGGYKCSAFGIQQGGGDLCFQSSVWVLDYSSMLWSEILKPTAPGDPYIDFAVYWPNARAYAVATRWQQYVIYQGGGFQDASSVWFYYSDSYLFDTSIMQFVPLETKGTPPLMSWSAAAGLQGNDMYLFGGCFGESYSGQLLSLRMGYQILSDNCFAFGSGLSRTTAGSQAEFWIQTRESVKVKGNNTIPPNSAVTKLSNDFSIVWGKNLIYGTGMAFSAQLVSSVGLVPAKVTGLTGGLYHVTYTLESGSSFRLFVSLDQTMIPGSPFDIVVDPKSIVVPDQTTVSGDGVIMAKRGDSGIVSVKCKDEYGNEITDNRFLRNGTDADGLQQMQAAQVWYDRSNTSFILTAELSTDAKTFVPIPLSIMYLNNGVFNLTYSVPSEGDQFYLGIKLNNISLSGSPYTVTTYSSSTNFLSIILSVAGVLLLLSFCWVMRERAVRQRAKQQNDHALSLGASLELSESEYARVKQESHTYELKKQLVKECLVLVLEVGFLFTTWWNVYSQLSTQTVDGVGVAYTSIAIISTMAFFVNSISRLLGIAALHRVMQREREFRQDERSHQLADVSRKILQLKITSVGLIFDAIPVASFNFYRCVNVAAGSGTSAVQLQISLSLGCLLIGEKLARLSEFSALKEQRLTLAHEIQLIKRKQTQELAKPDLELTAVEQHLVSVIPQYPHHAVRPKNSTANCRASPPLLLRTQCAIESVQPQPQPTTATSPLGAVTVDPSLVDHSALPAADSLVPPSSPSVIDHALLVTPLYTMDSTTASGQNTGASNFSGTISALPRSPKANLSDFFAQEESAADFVRRLAKRRQMAAPARTHSNETDPEL